MAYSEIAHELGHVVLFLGGAGEYIIFVALGVGILETQTFDCQSLIGIGAVIGITVGIG